MERMADIELNQAALDSVKSNYAHCKLPQVEASLAVNAHAAAFYMAARHVEKHAQNRLLGWAKRLDMTEEGLRDLSARAASEYIRRTFPQISKEDEALIRSAVSSAFPLGARYMEARLGKPGRA